MKRGSYAKFSTNSEALSSVVGMILILAIVLTSISAIWVNYVPVVRKNAEIKFNEGLRKDFMNLPVIYSLIKENQNEVISMKLGGVSTVFGQLTTSSTLKVNRSGVLTLYCTFNNTLIQRIFYLFSLELYTHNEILPNQAFVFSEGGLKIIQSGKNITKLKPDIGLEFDNGTGTLKISVDNLTTKSQTISGNGVAYIKFSFTEMTENYSNCVGYLAVNDTIFGDNWIYTMEKLSEEYPTIFNLIGSKLKFKERINVSLTVRNFGICLS